MGNGYGLGIPIIRIVVFLGLYWGPPILGNYLEGQGDLVARLMGIIKVTMGLLASFLGPPDPPRTISDCI